ncbi:uncharacterized protein LOC120678648 isoform X2 [Panicum virgatum]|uniref:Uncharacterized protein n=1 Tax=Panicum virgatum TaxID=38727 RepID=A0A8T0R4H5_PANVG|nr:uncharacterized protein LOC120678648 isoform X2 [Panicum virgatum]KAG2580196.1 hypothetical protein PVAP13_6NG322501 [Panicum virgatum]
MVPPLAPMAGPSSMRDAASACAARALDRGGEQRGLLARSRSHSAGRTSSAADTAAMAGSGRRVPRGRAPSPHHPSPRWPATAGRRKARRASSFLPTWQWRAGPWRWMARSARRRPSKVQRRPDPRGSGGAPSSVAGVLQLARWSSPAMCVARAVTMEGCSPHTRRGDVARQSCGPHHFRSAAFFLTQEAKLLPHRDPHALVLLGFIHGASLLLLGPQVLAFFKKKILQRRKRPCLIPSMHLNPSAKERVCCPVGDLNKRNKTRNKAYEISSLPTAALIGGPSPNATESFAQELVEMSVSDLKFKRLPALELFSVTFKEGVEHEALLD